MAKILIEIEIDNAAFQDEPAGVEVARILRLIAQKVDGEDLCEPRFEMSLRDINGNRVGKARAVPGKLGRHAK